ncbi:hypothetical protein CYY_005365 [Polysphondylium violaceum]|uniref:OTU domain-containing protein n=1 Tax=Polysphondylium violaceum TaxID=133409 RepID=A0A8J4PTM4_9MYCE|nr:hypothetical protein CYY_005365 [Polysphondylium violaceum]
MGKKKTNKLIVNLSDDEDQQQKQQEEQDIKDENIVKEEEEEEEEEEEKKESKGKMIQRHKLELKVTNNYNNHQYIIESFNTKKDKKAKSDFQDKAKKIEDELKKKQQAELENYESGQVQLDLNQLIINKEQKGPSKAQLKKAQKLADEEKRMKELEEEKKKFVSKGVVEFTDFMTKLKPLNKTIKHINPDGDCLYSAIGNQLFILNIIDEAKSKQYQKELRKKASDYIMENKDEFLPYIISEEEYSDSPDPIADYCQDQVLTIGKWGGHLELKALSHSLKLPITIHNAYSQDIIIGEEFMNESKSNSMHLSYHRHAFTLGEHYNSVIPLITIENNNNSDEEQ